MFALRWPHAPFPWALSSGPAQKKGLDRAKPSQKKGLDRPQDANSLRSDGHWSRQSHPDWEGWLNFQPSIDSDGWQTFLFYFVYVQNKKWKPADSQLHQYTQCIFSDSYPIFGWIA